jgi:hypothetical protein
MRSGAKRGQSGPRYRVNVDAKDDNGRPLKGVPLVRVSRRGVMKRAYAAATIVRIKLENEKLAGRNSLKRLEEPAMLWLLRDVPSVPEIALAMLREARKPREAA